MPKNLTAGIVAEYNPFHAGHAWMIEQLRAKGYETIVCVMSGSYVQRAEPALLPPHIRTKAALLGGADLVLRLPTPWATASAERFAEGAVGILSALGCVDTLAFGAETADTALLQQTAGLLLEDGFSALLKEELAKGVSFAAARAAAAQRVLPGAGQLLNSPNNILGIEYCKALQRTVPLELTRMVLAADGIEVPTQNAIGVIGMPPFPAPLAIPRVGTGHDKPPAGGYASASWLRAQVGSAGAAALKGYVPAEALPLYEQAIDTGEVLDPARWELALLSRLRGMGEGAFAKQPGTGEGLAQRLAAAARKATTAQELYALAKTKRFAHSRVRRAALGAALHTPAGLGAVPPFIQVLGANKRGFALLKAAKQTAQLPLSTSLAGLAKTGEAAAKAAAFEAAAEDVYNLCLAEPKAGGTAFTQPAVFL